MTVSSFAGAALAMGLALATVASAPAVSQTILPTREETEAAIVTIARSQVACGVRFKEEVSSGSGYLEHHNVIEENDISFVSMDGDVDLISEVHDNGGRIAYSYSSGPLPPKSSKHVHTYTARISQLNLGQTFIDKAIVYPSHPDWRSVVVPCHEGYVCAENYFTGTNETRRVREWRFMACSVGDAERLQNAFRHLKNFYSPPDKPKF